MKALNFALRAVGLCLVVAGMASVALARRHYCGPQPAPEMDPASASSALAVLSGLLLIARDKFRR